MPAPPSMRLYVGDLIQSTQEMTAEVFGAYCRLLFYQWDRGHLPKTDRQRQLVCKVTEQRWEEIWDELSERFVTIDEAGNLGHPRINRERPEAFRAWKSNAKLAEKRKKAGKQGAKARWHLDGKTDGNCHSFAIGKTIANDGNTGIRNKEEGKRKKEEGRRKEEVDQIAAHYLNYHPKARPGKKDRAKIIQRLSEGYTVEDLQQAIDGCHVSPFHCGENDQGKKFQSLELIMRDSKHVLEFMEAWEQRDAPVLSEKERRGARAKQNVLRRLHDGTGRLPDHD